VYLLPTPCLHAVSCFHFWLKSLWLETSFITQNLWHQAGERNKNFWKLHLNYVCYAVPLKKLSELHLPYLQICPPNPPSVPTARHQRSIMCNCYAPGFLCSVLIKAYPLSFWKDKRSPCTRSNTGRKREVEPCGLSHGFLLYHLT